MNASAQMAKIAKKYEEIIPEYLESPDFVETATEARDQFVKTRRLGKTAGYTGDKLKDLAPLSEKYKELRKKHKNRLGEKGTPGKSNATATGQMLRSLAVKITKKGFEMSFEGSRSGELAGGQSRLTNEEVATYYNDKRPFAYLSSSELNKLIREIRQQLVERYSKAAS